MREVGRQGRRCSRRRRRLRITHGVSVRCNPASDSLTSGAGCSATFLLGEGREQQSEATVTRSLRKEVSGMCCRFQTKKLGTTVPQAILASALLKGAGDQNSAGKPAPDIVLLPSPSVKNAKAAGDATVFGRAKRLGITS